VATYTINDYRSALSRDLGDISRSPWIPWKWVRWNYTPGAPKPLSALFDAYRTVSSLVELSKLVPEEEGFGNGSCIRCGTCCSSLNPGLTNQERYQEWLSSGTLTGLFFREVARPSAEENWYAGWFHKSVRLRICPLLYYCPETGAHWCAVYYLGPGHRPEACESFPPAPPDCWIS
jgi:hypothetical protein